MIGYWHYHVDRLSVRPTVCNAVHSGSQDRCTGLKLYQRVPGRHVPICPSRHFGCRTYVSFSHKTHR